MMPQPKEVKPDKTHEPAEQVVPPLETRAHPHKHTLPPLPPHTHTHTHAHTNARTHARSHTNGGG